MGEESEKLVTFAPARHPYIFDQANGRFLDVGR
jgi:hypothetical protein